MHDLSQSTRITGGHFFDSAKVEEMISAYQCTGSTELLGSVIRLCEPIALSLIRGKGTMQYEDESELLSIIHRKLLVSLPQFDRARGSAFSFVSRLTVNMLATTTVTLRRKLASRYTVLDDTLVATVADNGANLHSQLALEDLKQQIRSTVRSTCTLPVEREALKWFIASFFDSDFALRRHEMANACMRVYGLGHRRSRDLHDLAMLEVRRSVWNEMRHGEVDARSLRGTRNMALLRYTNFLTPPEFSKLVHLLRDPAPSSLILLVKPENESWIKSGCWDAVRENLLLILNGDPAPTPLFS